VLSLWDDRVEQIKKMGWQVLVEPSAEDNHMWLLAAPEAVDAAGK
jgi:hypothetical protein